MIFTVWNNGVLHHHIGRRTNFWHWVHCEKRYINGIVCFYCIKRKQYPELWAHFVHFAQKPFCCKEADNWNRWYQIMRYIGNITTVYCSLSTVLEQLVLFIGASRAVQCWHTCYSEVTVCRDQEMVERMQLAWFIWRLFMYILNVCFKVDSKEIRNWIIQ